MDLIFADIKNKESQKYVTLDIGTSDSKNVLPRDAAFPLKQYPGKSANDPFVTTQHWLRVINENGTSKWLSRASGWAVDAQGGNFTQGTILQEYPPTGNPNQQWIVEGEADLVNIFAVNDKTAWDIPGGSHADGAQIALTEFTNANSQLWRVRAQSSFRCYAVSRFTPYGEPSSLCRSVVWRGIKK